MVKGNKEQDPKSVKENAPCLRNEAPWRFFTPSGATPLTRHHAPYRVITSVIQSDSDGTDGEYIEDILGSD